MSLLLCSIFIFVNIVSFFFKIISSYSVILCPFHHFVYLTLDMGTLPAEFYLIKEFIRPGQAVLKLPKPCHGVDEVWPKFGFLI